MPHLREGSHLFRDVCALLEGPSRLLRGAVLYLRGLCPIRGYFYAY